VRRLIPHLAAAGVIAACAWLTNWQLERADYKRDVLAGWNDREPVALASIRAPFDLPRPVTALGNWRPNRQLLIDNQVRDGRQGVWVLTPLRLRDGRVFLVNRGWAAWPSRGDPLPDPAAPSATEMISGVLSRGPAVGVRLGKPRVPADPEWPLLVTYFDPEAMIAAYGAGLQPAVVQLDPGHPAHLTGEAWRKVSFGPDRHLGYALTWATMALVAGVIWIALGARALKRSALKRSKQSR